MAKPEKSLHLRCIDLEEQLWRETPRQWYARIAEQTSGNLINLHQIVVNRFATPNQLSRLFKVHNDHGRPLPALRKWAEQSHDYTQTLPHTGVDFRRTVHRQHGYLIYHYQTRRQPEHAKAPRRYVIGVTGDMALLMAPVPYVLEALGLLGWDVLVIRRLRPEPFLAGDGSGLDQLVAALLKILPPEYRRRGVASALDLTVLGTSTGALPALVLAERLRARRGIALGVLASEAMLEPGALVDRCRQRGGGLPPATTRMLLAYPANHALDCEHAQRVAGFYARQSARPRRLTLRGYANCDGHTLHTDLVRNGWSLTEIHRHLLSDSARTRWLARLSTNPLPAIQCTEKRVI